MPITMPTLTNSGFRTKRVQVTYQKPAERSECLGSIPWTESYDPGIHLPGKLFAPLPDNHKSGYHPVYQSNPVLDNTGKPIINTVTETIEVPGPKGEALCQLGGRTLLGALGGAVPGMGLVLLGAFGTLVGGAAAQELTQTGFELMALGGTVGAGIGLASGTVKAAKLFGRTNSLSWSAEKIATKKMTGMKFTHAVNATFVPIANFEPVFSSKEFGSWSRPLVQMS